MTDPSILRTGFDTRPIEMQPMWALMFQAPSEDVDRIFDAVTRVAPLTQGKTDRNGYRAPGGLEYYRPGKARPPAPRTTRATARTSTRCASSCPATPPC